MKRKSTIKRFDVTSKEFQDNPYQQYEEVHEKNLILFDEGIDAYFIGRYRDVDHILKSADFSTAPLAKRAEPVMGDRVLAQMTGKEHSAKRKAVLSGLTGKLFRDKHAKMITETTNSILENYLHVGKIDLIKDFGKTYSILVTLQILELPTIDYEKIAEWHRGIASFITSLKLTEQQHNYSMECSRNLINYLTPIVENHMNGQGNSGFISILCEHENEGERMSISEIVALILNILLAATEPSDKTLAYLFKHLLDNPDQFLRIKRDRSLIPDAIDESLRLTSPVQLIPRLATKKATISGIDIPENSLVFCLIGAANRDPDVFKTPDIFDIDRKEKERASSLGKAAHHLAFGSGILVCVGAAFSIRQIELTTNIILNKMKNIRISDGFEYSEYGLYTRGPVSLPLEFDPVKTQAHEKFS